MAEQQLSQCPYCDRPVDIEGCINHVGTCEGLKSAGLNRLQHHLLTAEIERLNKWADGFSDAQLKERQTAEAYQRELRAEIERLRTLVRKALFAWEGTGPPLVLDELRKALGTIR